jgi:hypothetical protein
VDVVVGTGEAEVENAYWLVVLREEECGCSDLVVLEAAITSRMSSSMMMINGKR